MRIDQPRRVIQLYPGYLDSRWPVYGPSSNQDDLVAGYFQMDPHHSQSAL